MRRVMQLTAMDSLSLRRRDMASVDHVQVDRQLAKVYWIVLGVLFGLSALWGWTRDWRARCKTLLPGVVQTGREITLYQPWRPERRWKRLLWHPPPLGTWILLLGYLVLMLALLLAQDAIRPSSDPERFEVLSFRAAWLSVAQLPLIALTSSMGWSVLGVLGRVDSAKWNILHRWTGRSILITSALHGFPLVREWVVYDVIESELKTSTARTGLAAWLVLLVLVLASISPIRQKVYEVFWLGHVLSSVTFLVLVGIHVPSYARGYLWACVAIFALQRVARIVKMIGRTGRRAVVAVDLRALQDGATEVIIREVASRWKPGEHLFLGITDVGIGTSHPFTIAEIIDDDARLVARAHGGFTRRLNELAKKQPGRTRKARVEGTYGVLPEFCRNEIGGDRLLLICGGSGASYGLAMLAHLIRAGRRSPEVGLGADLSQISMVWAVKSLGHVKWYDDQIERLLASDALDSLSIEVFVTASSQRGRESLNRHASEQNLMTAGYEPQVLSDLEVDSEKSVPYEAAGVRQADILTDDPTWRDAHPRLYDRLVVRHGRPVLHSTVLQAMKGMPPFTDLQVVVCGPEEMKYAARQAVVQTSDALACHKGGVSHGVKLFIEDYGT